jgi:hypothetical protein
MTDIFQYQKKETLFITPDPEGYQAFKINSNLNQESIEFKNFLKNVEFEKWIDLSEPILSLLAFAFSMIEEGSKKRIYTFTSDSELNEFINSFTTEKQKLIIMKARFAFLLDNFSLDVLDPYCLTLYPTDYKRRHVFPVRVLYENISSKNLEFLRVAVFFFAYMTTKTK